MKFRILAIALAFTFQLLAACGSANSELTIGGAASLGPVLQEISKLYKERYPERTLLLSLASSGAIARQIEQGAPIDLFFSAAEDKMQALEDQGLIQADSRRTVLQNTLVLIVLAGRDESAPVAWEQLLSMDGSLAIGEPESVPAGKYARQWLHALGIWEGLEPKMVFTSNVRQALVYTERAEVAAGIVYGSDAAGSKAVKIVAVGDANRMPKISYPLAITRQSENLLAAQEFMEWLFTEEAVRQLFQEYGFIWSLE